jgi:uncharacterized RDD family membrane protein YckC
MDERNPYSAPVARVADDTGSAPRALAEPHTRLWAYLVDSVLWIVVVLAGAAAGGVFLGVTRAAEIEAAGDSIELLRYFGPIVGSTVVAALAWGIYNCVLLYRYGQTVGKRIFSIRIVRTDGRRASFLRIFFLRMFLNGILQSVPLGLGLLYWLVDSLFIVRDDRRCIHDHIADTIVVITS